MCRNHWCKENRWREGGSTWQEEQTWKEVVPMKQWVLEELAWLMWKEVVPMKQWVLEELH